MLAIVENYLQALGATRSEAEVTRVLRDAATGFGFRSAYLIEYAGKLSAVQHVLDTDQNRRTWWTQYFASDLRPSPREFGASLLDNAIHRYDDSRFGPGSERLRAACQEYDVVDVTAVSISHAGELVGVGGFCGTPKLDRQQETALQLVVYSAFARMRTNRSTTTNSGPDVRLTPRERDVMRLSATGLTSAEIAGELGMSPRTVNQHVDNVADKLGTRNRAHTVAEIVRRGLL
jgi:LuxR family quorum sensing-dependent transcriptional regulator